MNAVQTITDVPLSALKAADANVRTVPAREDSIDELKASIRAHGLLQNLSVRAASNGAAPSYHVIGGVRRLAALQSLAEEGHIAPDAPIPCRIASSGDHDTEISLAENVLRVAMHPADEVVAFRRLADEGMSPTDIANRFGVSGHLVDQRLRLGGLAPEIIAAAREGRINLEQMKAFAASADQERQVALWNLVKEQGYIPHAGYIQREMLSGYHAATSRRAQLVGLEAYEAAGGAVERDLFAADDERGITLTDTALLERLCMEKLEKTAAELRAAGWKWAESHLEANYETVERYGRLRGARAEPTAEQKAEEERLQARLAEIEAEFEANPEWREMDDPPEDHPACQRITENEELEGALSRLTYDIDGRRSYPPEQMAHAGCIVSIGYEGIEVTEGLVRDDDVAALKAVTAGQAGDNGSDGGGDGYRSPMRNLSPEGQAAQTVKDAGLTGPLGEHLRLVRNAIVKTELAGSFAAAFDLAAYQLATSAFERNGRSDKALDMSLTATSDCPTGTDEERRKFLAASPGPAALKANEQNLPLDWIEERDPARRFAAFRALPLKDRKQLFAAAVATSLKAQLSFDYGARAETEATVARLDIGFARTWRPDLELYWSRMRKTEMLGIARSVLGAEWAAAHAKDKKGELAAAMHAVFGAEDTPEAAALPRAARNAARAWSPNGFGAFERARDTTR